MKKKKVTLDIFQEAVLPQLQAKHASPDDLQKAVTDGYEVVEVAEDGTETPVLIDVKKAKADATEATNVDEDSIERLVEKVIGKAASKVGDRPRIENIKDRSDDDPKFGFKHFGEFASATAKHATRNGNTDDRLLRIKAPTNYMNEATGADGGFLVPPDFTAELLRNMYADDALLPLTRQVTTRGNTLTFPIDESTPWGTTGIQAYWTAEGAVKTDSKPVLGEANITLHKLAVLVPVTDELLQDSFIGLGQYIAQFASERIRHKVNAAIVAGTGVGQPLGYRNSGALVTVAKEAGQTADTVNVTNIAKMYGAFSPASEAASRWLYHSSVFPQFVGMSIGNQPVYTNSITDARPASSLFGIQTVKSQEAAVLGDLGDIDLVDFSQYLTVTKGTGVEQAMSIHLYFDRDITTFRFVFRVGGRPWMSTPITQKDGTTTISPFVTLAARA